MGAPQRSVPMRRQNAPYSGALPLLQIFLGVLPCLPPPGPRTPLADCLAVHACRGDEAPAPAGSAPAISELDPDMDMDWQPSGATAGAASDRRSPLRFRWPGAGGERHAGGSSESQPGEMRRGWGSVCQRVDLGAVVRRSLTKVARHGFKQSRLAGGRLKRSSVFARSIGDWILLKAGHSSSSLVC